METNCKAVTEAIITALQYASEMDKHIDSTDSTPVEETKDKFTFTVTKDVLKPGASRLHTAPQGRLIYTITVEAKYEVQED